MEAIGVAAPVSLPFNLNFLSKSESAGDDPNQPVHIVLGEKEFDISPNYARNISIIIAVALVIPFLAIFLIVPNFVNKKQAELDEINSKLQNVTAEIKRIEEERNGANGFNPIQEIKNVMTYNRTKLIGYSALGDSVTKNLWITYFSTNGEDKFDIKGESENVEDIYAFYRNNELFIIKNQNK